MKGGERQGLGALTTALAPISWGTTFVVTTELLPPDRPLFAGVLRALPVGLVVMAAYRRWPPRGWIVRIALLGCINIGLFFPLLFVAAYRLPGGLAATAGALQPTLVAVLGWRLLGERPRWRTFVASGVCLAGLGLMMSSSRVRLDPVGIAAAVGATAAMSLGIVLTKRWGRPAALPLYTAWQLAVGGLVLLPMCLVVEGMPRTLTAVNVGGFAYMATVSTAAAYAVWFRGLERLSAQTAAFLPLLSPVVAASLGYAVLGQTLAPLQLAGAFAVLVGVFATILPGGVPASATRPAPPPRQPLVSPDAPS